MSWNSPDADRWQCPSGSVKVLIPSPHSPLQMMHKAGNKYQVGKASDKEEAKQRQLKGILNKLTPQNFDKLFEQFKEVNIDNVVTLTGVISQIFDKALMEPTFCEMYANFCSHLAGEIPDFVGEDNEKITFKRLLLNKCQEEFERGEREQAEADGVEEDSEVKRSEEERVEKRIQACRRMLGNIRLIGELYKKKMLTERIMHECIKKLLGQYQKSDEEDVEALCKLMSTIGEIIDHPKAKEHMDAYFERMQKLSNNQMLSSRVRFMLKDVIDLRKNRWQQQRNPLQMMHKAGNKYQVGKASDKEETKRRQLKGILNKLMPQNFDKLLEQLEEVTIDNVATLAGFVSQIFDKAIREPTFCEMYANFFFHLAGELPDFVDEDNEKITFKRLLLNKCQEEFERCEREQAEADGVEEDGEVKRSEEEREEKRIQARRRMLGNIRLIGELYKKKMLTERIMHECIKKLLGQDQNPDEEDVEALCKLMSTIGEIIDHPKAKEHMDAYFERMQKLSNNQMLSSRVRFMLKDVIDLRKNRWQQRRKIERPKMIKEVHRDAAQWRMAQNSSDADWWQRALDYVKDLIPTLYSPYPIMHKDGKEHEVGRISEEEDAPQRKLKGIVWKQTHKRNQLKGILKTLTPLNFDKILKQVKAVNMVNLCTLVDFISQIFDEALREPIFCEMYANFCYNVAGEFLECRTKVEKKINFRRLLVRKCWEEFERSEREKAEADRVEEDGAVKSSEEEREEKMVRARKRMLGSIQLIAELYKKRMLPDKIMHASIQNLLGQDQNPDEEDVEALCKLMSTVGEIIDHPRAMKVMDVYFERMQKLSNNQKMSSRVMFMLKDTIDLRNNRWQQMRKFEDPKKIEEVHRDAAQGGMARNSPDADKWASGSQKGCTPPHFPLQMMHKAWKKYEVGMVSDEEEAKQRQLKGILNKLVPQNLDTFLEQVEEVNIDNVVTLADFVSQIFDRVLREPIFCEMYVNFCFHLADELPPFIGEDNKWITFRRLLVSKC